MLSNPVCFKLQRKLPVSWAPGSRHLSPHGQTAERSWSSIWTVTIPRCSTGQFTQGLLWEVRGESCGPHWLCSRSQVLVGQETGWELTAARKHPSTPVLLTLLVFPLVILKIGDRSEPNVPCTDVSIDFKLCKLYCLKIFVKWLNWTFSKEALSISKLTTSKCIFLLLFLYSVSSCGQIRAVRCVQ